MSPARPAVSVITPSRDQLGQLKLCRSSVADQQGVACEHIVIDGASSDGTAEWLRRQPGILWFHDDGVRLEIAAGVTTALIVPQLPETIGLEPVEG